LIGSTKIVLYPIRQGALVQGIESRYAVSGSLQYGAPIFEIEVEVKFIVSVSSICVESFYV